ncbi:IS1595 family transposase [Agrobacterium vitis]
MLSPYCRTFTLRNLRTFDEERSYKAFCLIRWPDTKGKPTCVRCSHSNCWEIRRRRFKCQACRREFSVTTGTVFAFRKMSFQDILAGLWFSVNSVKGKSALQLSRELGCQYKTAWVLLMKMREAISTRRFRMMLEGEIHIDGKYAGGHIKPENRKEDRVDRRRAENQNFKRLTILTLREKTPFGRGREQTLTRVIRSEDSNEAWEMVRKHVRKGSRLHADEHFSYDDLEGLQELHRVNHSQEYQTDGGVNTNHVESFFSRIQRAYVGIHHRFSVRYFDWYAAEIAWREDNRRVDNGLLLWGMLHKALSRPTSRNLCGYWQGNHPHDLVWEGGVSPETA